jgi:hypothetical protein
MPVNHPLGSETRSVLGFWYLQESLEQLFAATALGEDPLCRALKRLHTALDEPSGFSNVQVSPLALAMWDAD